MSSTANGNRAADRWSGLACSDELLAQGASQRYRCTKL